MIKEIFISILKFLIVFILLFLLLIIVNLIPKTAIENNVEKSLKYFIKEGYYPKVRFIYNYILDNYTDALMVNTAYSVDSNKPLESAILMRRSYRPNENLKLEEVVMFDKPIDYWIENVNKTNDTYFQYQRYWHGYMIYLRPLLVFFNYSQIRVILISVITNLSLLLTYLTYKRINIYVSLATLFVLIVSNFICIGMSLTYSAVFIIMLISSIYIITKCEKKNDKKIFDTFLIIGMLTSFFDLFTTPLLTFGIPAIYYLIIRNRENKLNINSLLKIMIGWGLGYGIMWFLKWIICDIIYQTGTIKESFREIFLYTASNELIRVNALKSINRNLFYVKYPIILLTILAFISIIINKKVTKLQIITLIIGILPFLWYVIIKGHSYIHDRFTYRDLLITILALSIIIISNIKSNTMDSR